MDMDMNTDGSTSDAVLSLADYCYPGNHNGSWPNGTFAGGDWLFGYYVPTMDQEMNCQAAYGSWDASVKYAYWTIYLIIGFFFVSSLLNQLQHYELLSRSVGLPPIRLIPARLKAAFHALDTPRPHRLIPPLGSILAGVALSVFGLAVTFAIRPYYRPPNYGSPPLGLRSEWLATAPIVFVFATAVKRNALGWLTGISFARLMDLHKILGWFILFFSSVHTGAMIKQALMAGPWKYYYQSQPLSYGWAAWGALISLLWLCVMSLGPIRRLSHEVFYILHMAAAFLFVLCMYAHGYMALNTWAYLHAAVVVAGLAVVHRFGVVAYNTRGFTRVWRAWVEPTEDGALLIRIPARGFTWSAGDHVYVRFLTVYAWQTHPFTVMNLPHPDPSSSQSELHILLRPRTGLTAKLAKHASLRPHLSFPVHLDGPYAATSNVLTTLAGSDEVLLVAGGTGMSYVLPLLTALAVRGGVSRREHRVKLVWVVPRRSCITWYKAEIDTALAAVAAGGKLSHSVLHLSITIHVSSEPAGAELADPLAIANSAGEEKKDGAGDSLLGAEGRLEVVGGRPDVGRIVRDATGMGRGTVCVVGCGPGGLLREVRNGVGRAQLGIAKGREEGAEEVVYVEELFE